MLLSAYVEAVQDYWNDWHKIRPERDLKKISDV